MPSPSEDLLEEPIADSAEPDFPQPRSGLGGCIGSLFLLIFGSSVAGILGIVLAINNPQEMGKKPPLVWLWEKLPFGASETFPPEAIAPTSPPDEETRALQQREQLEAEIANLEKQWQTLRDSTAQLERQLELPVIPDDSLGDRLQALQQKVLLLPPLSSTASTTSEAISQTQVSLPGTKLKVTLPSDLLFANHSELSSEGSLILDTIVTDLAKHKGATIRIAAHTDTRNSPSESRELSFQLARTVEQYLASSLRGNYRWVSIGYGQAHPLVANNTDSNRQRNRRIEIAVD